MTIRVYQYGLLPPTVNADVVRAQMRAAHKYRNTLTMIEQQRRAKLRELYAASSIAPLEVAAREAEAALEQVFDEARSQRSIARSKTDSEEIKAAIADAKKQRKAAGTALREARTKLRTDPAIVAATDNINEEAHQARKAARSETETWWGTYLLVEASDEQARKTTPLYDGLNPNDTRFARWTGDARVGALLIHGLSVTEAFDGQDTKLQIVRSTGPSPRKDGTPRRAGKKDHRVLRMRVGSEGRSPVFAEWPMILHRPMPANGTIKNVVVSVRRIGPTERWTVQFTVSEPDEARPEKPGVCAVDIGWRVIGDEIRVCRWAADDGKSGELRLDAKILSRFRKVEDLRSIRDKNFDRALALLITWKPNVINPPEWWKPVTANMHAWKSQARLASLVNRWSKERFAGDELAFEAASGWAKQDRHLWQWESAQRARAHGWRREIYRIFAAGLARAYGKVVLEKFDLRVFSVRPQLGVSETQQEVFARANRHLVATSELRLCLVNAFRRGGEVVEQSAVDTTRQCHVCGVVETFDAAAKIEHTCANGHEWDQDDNAARNLLFRFERSRDDENTEGARNQENTPVAEKKWARAARMRAEKQSRKTALENTADKVAE